MCRGLRKAIHIDTHIALYSGIIKVGSGLPRLTGEWGTLVGDECHLFGMEVVGNVPK